MQRETRLKIFKIYKKFLHGSLYEENLDQPLGRADRHDITEILLKVVLNTIKPTNPMYP
jgi:hypothetical protein